MAVTTILFKRGNSPISQVNLRPGEPGWTLDTGELYIGMPNGEPKKINTLGEEDVQEITSQIDSIREIINQLHPPPTYPYTRYAIDEQGTGFAKTFNPAIHKYKGVYVSLVQLSEDQVTVKLFEGLWELYAPTYTYTAYASDGDGSNFSLEYIVGTHTHRAVITRTYLAPDEIVPALFADRWEPWAPDDVYDGGGW